MQKHYRNFLQSVVAFPLLALQLAVAPVGAVSNLPTAAAISPEQNRNLASETTDNNQLDLITKGAKIDAYLAGRESPLEGYGLVLAKAAEDNGLDYRVIAAVAVVESGAGAKKGQACKKDPENVFGFMSCKKVDFDSYEEAIDTVARTLGGNIKSSAYHYVGKSLKGKLIAYNGAANPNYVPNVMITMNKIDQMDVEVPRPTLAGLPEVKA